MKNVGLLRFVSIVKSPSRFIYSSSVQTDDIVCQRVQTVSIVLYMVRTSQVRLKNVLKGIDSSPLMYSCSGYAYGLVKFH